MIKTVLFILLATVSLHARIIQTNRMEEVLSHVDKTTWVLFDIDNTVMESAIQAGTREWFDHEVEQLMAAQGLDRQTADGLLGPEWDSFMEICPIQTPEPNTADLVKIIQKKSGASFALTARHQGLSKLTLRQLEQLEMNFSGGAPAEVSLESSHPIHWEQGVLFASCINSKGTLFRQLLEKSEKKPKRVVFIDDTKRHLEGMERELQALGIEFIGFHYTKSVERPFDPEVASKEYREILQKHCR